MKSFALVMFSVLAVSAFMGCAAHKEVSAPFVEPVFQQGIKNKPWTNQKFQNDPDDFQFLVISDVNGGERRGIIEDAVRKINLMMPEFVICVGDLIPGYSKDENRIKGQRDRIDEIFSRLKMPFFYVPGNHDITYPEMRDSWEKRYGTTYYHFVYKDCLFLCMNSHDPEEHHFSDDQLDYMKKALDENRHVRWTFVFFHHPLWKYNSDTNWSGFTDLVKGRRHTVFAGHTHVYMKQEMEGMDYVVLSTTGGGNTLVGPELGRFDHLTWVTVAGKEPEIANISVDGVFDRNLCTPEKSSLLWPFYDGRAIDVRPIVVDSDTFENGETTIQVRNNSGYPVKYRASLEENPIFAAEPTKIDLSIAPGEVGEATMKIRAMNTISFEERIQAALRGEAQFEYPDPEPLKTEGTKPLVFERKEYMRRTQTPLVVDGFLEDWDSLPFECTKPAQIQQRKGFWRGVEDASFRFGVRYDEQYLYLGLEAKDDMNVYDPKRSRPWRSDSLEIRINANPDPERSDSKGQDEYKAFLLFVLNPSSPGEEERWYAKERLPEGCKAVCLKNESGFMAEIALPMSYVTSLQGEDWDAVRVNVCFNDFDKGSESDGAKVWWRPDWRGGLNYPGSGTLYRSDR